MIENKLPQGRVITGKVISNNTSNTIVVEIVRKVKHPLYGKYETRQSRMHVHVDKATCQVGDVVAIKQSRPISKTKHWVLLNVVESAKNV